MNILVIVHGASIGYYQGDVQKLIEDVQMLKPTIFAGVPRIYNKIYASIKARMDEATGCKRLLIDWAF
jgi:long-chain acyl-CoA synthetase